MLDISDDHVFTLRVSDNHVWCWVSVTTILVLDVSDGYVLCWMTVTTMFSVECQGRLCLVLDVCDDHV